MDSKCFLKTINIVLKKQGVIEGSIVTSRNEEICATEDIVDNYNKN